MTWNRSDLAAGLIFLGIGSVLAVYALATLEIGSAATMGPGFFPLALCVILIVLGAGILFSARNHEAEPAAPINWRGVIFVLAAPIAFGMTLRSLGLVPSLAIAMTLAVAASRHIGFSRGAAIVTGMTAFCVAVFYYGLRVPVELVNSGLFH
ncbi:Tripartite tricarboxylate transporter TctB family protein [Hyphomicrobiales bacterium]|nr:Tripartite tricarboxylate transporter TctB family protein [Hyphomicrobiales bacterium]CAH1692168.1 Tripartite tricarboxylate transporter TctB family protein [Hyphomicrobiales bacterium]